MLQNLIKYQSVTLMQVLLYRIIEAVHNNVLKCAMQSLEGILNRFCNMIQYDTTFNM